MYTECGFASKDTRPPADAFEFRCPDDEGRLAAQDHRTDLPLTARAFVGLAVGEDEQVEIQQFAGIRR